jgi:hypothetical protein
VSIVTQEPERGEKPQPNGPATGALVAVLAALTADLGLARSLGDLSGVNVVTWSLSSGFRDSSP